MADQPQDDKSNTKSRYELVQSILENAQGNANPSYQGHKRFWLLPLEEFLRVTVYGVRMIAPAGEEDFCRDQMAAASTSSARSCCESEQVSVEEPPESPPASTLSLHRESATPCAGASWPPTPSATISKAPRRV